jgi:hypothetical protein
MVQNQIFSNYANQKTNVIMKILKMADYNEYRLVEATEENEINDFKMLTSLKKISFDDPNVFHLCLYKGRDPVAAILLEFCKGFSKANIKKINALHNESRKVIMGKIEEWLEFRNTILENESLTAAISLEKIVT